MNYNDTPAAKRAREKYMKKTYQRFLLTLRNVDDKELLDFIESHRDPGESDSALIKKLLYELLNK